MTADVTEQFQTLRAVTDLTGGLHERQLVPLRTLGLACSSSVVEVEIGWRTGTAPCLLYRLTLDPLRVEADFGRRIEALKRFASGIMRGWSVQVRVRRLGTHTDQDLPHG